MDDDLYEDLDVLDEDDDGEDLDEEFAALLEEDDEARRRRRRRPVRTGGGRNYYGPRAQPGKSVSQTQLQVALARVQRDVKTNAKAIKTVNGRVSATSAQQRRQAAQLKREVAARKKETAKLKSNLQMATLLPLLSSGNTVTTTAESGGVPAGTKLQTAPDSFSSLLPLLLMGDGLGGGGGGGGDSSGLLLALVLSQGRK